MTEVPSVGVAWGSFPPPASPAPLQELLPTQRGWSLGWPFPLLPRPQLSPLVHDSGLGH